MRKYQSLGAGTHVINFDIYPPRRVKTINIETDNSCTIKDNLGLLDNAGGSSPLTLDGVLNQNIGQTVGLSPIQFTIVTTATATKVWISVELD